MRIVFFLVDQYLLYSNSSCLVLQSSNSFGTSRSGSCFEIAVSDLNQIIVHTQASLVGFSFSFNDGTNRSYLENSVLTNNYSIELTNRVIIRVNIYTGKGVEGIQFQLDNTISARINSNPGKINRIFTLFEFNIYENPIFSDQFNSRLC
jgi:hypothetical protein